MRPFVDLLAEILASLLRQDGTPSFGESRMDRQAKKIAWIIFILLTLTGLALWLYF